MVSSDRGNLDKKKRRAGGVMMLSVAPWMLLVLLLSRAIGETAVVEPRTPPPAAVETSANAVEKSPAPRETSKPPANEKTTAEGGILAWIPEKILEGVSGGVDYTLGGIGGWSLEAPAGYAGEEVFFRFSGGKAEGEAFYRDVLTFYVEKLDGVGFAPTDEWVETHRPEGSWQEFNLNIAENGSWGYGMEGYFGDEYVAFSMVTSLTLEDIDALFGDEAPEGDGMEVEVLFMLAEKTS